MDDRRRKGKLKLKIPTVEIPDEDELEDMAYDSVVEATDGCMVKPDGTCPHGHVSWLIYFGIL